MLDSFTDSQLHALDTNRNLAIRANAGSGKTRVLVERIVCLLERGRREHGSFPLTAIVAITFTRKAAIELQERLSGALTRQLQSAPDEASETYWADRIAELPRAMIGTIDSFCGRILREFGLEDVQEPRIEPEFETLDDYDRRLLQEDAIDRVINRLSQGRGLGKGSDTRRHGADAVEAEACDWWARHEGYAALKSHLYSLLNHMVEPATIVACHARQAAADRVQAAWNSLPAAQLLQKDRNRHVGDLENLVDTIGPRPAVKLGELRDQLVKCLEAFRANDGRRDSEGLRILAEAFLTKENTPRKQGLNKVMATLQPLQDRWCEPLQNFQFDFDAELWAAEAADRLAILLGPVHDEYQSLCHARRAYDFLTLSRRMRDLLRQNAVIRAKLKARYRHILVDEFQDTNGLQWEILSWMVGDGPETLLDRDRLTIVGDPQQSIFRFRDADVGVFRQVQEVIRASNRHHGLAEVPTDHERERGASSTLEQRLGLMPLAENFRSLAPVPIDLVDQIASHAFDPEAQKIAAENRGFEIEYQRLRAGRAVPPGARGEVIYLRPPPVEATEAGTAGSEDAAEGSPSEPMPPAQVQAVVDQLVALYGQPRYLANPPTTLTWKDMAILLPARNVILTALEQELRRRCVPFVVSGGIGFWQRQEVRDIINLAACLADRGDELALFGVLRGPLGQCTDTAVLFLSQLGLGSLFRGLKALPAPGEPLGARSKDVWARLPASVQSALSETWGQWPTAEHEQLRATAQRLAAWSARVDRMSHSDLLQRALEESGAYALYAAQPEGEQILANLAQLFQEIRGDETRAPGTLARLARRLHDQTDRSPKEEQAHLAAGQDAVQVMTVHGAKGLQFPVVAVLRLERSLTRNSRSKAEVIGIGSTLAPEWRQRLADASPGLVSVCVRHPRRPRETYKPCLWKGLRDLDRQQQVAESRRLFYVALTRAEERLILAGVAPKKNGSGPKPSWQKWLEDGLGLQSEHFDAGLWEQGDLRLRIVSKVEGELRASALAPAPLTDRLDLETIPERPHFPRVTTTGLEKMRSDWREDRRRWWLRYGVHVLPEIALPGPDWLRTGPAERDGSIGMAIGTLVHRLFELGAEVLAQAPAERRPLLEAMAGAVLGLSRAVARGEEPDDAPPVPPEIRQVVEVVEAIVARIQQPRPGARAVRALLEARGRPEVEFALRLGRWHISGRYDKLIEASAGSGLQIIDWKTDRDDPAAIVSHYRPQMLVYALALHLAGQAALIDGAVPVSLVLLHHLKVIDLQYLPAELEAFADDLRRELDAMEAYYPVPRFLAGTKVTPG